MRTRSETSIEQKSGRSDTDWGVNKCWPVVFLASLLVYLTLLDKFLCWFELPFILQCGLFLPVAAAEGWASRREWVRLGPVHRERVFIFAPLRLLMLWFLFSKWVFAQKEEDVWLRSMLANFFGFFRWSLMLTPTLSLFMFLIAAGMHYVLWWRKGYGRFFTTIPVPFIISICSMLFWYHSSLRRPDVDQITAQPGVRLAVRYPQSGRASGTDDPFYHPRSVNYDPERHTIFLTTGTMLGFITGGTWKTPNVWAYHLDSGRWVPLKGEPAKAFALVRALRVDNTSDDIFVSGQGKGPVASKGSLLYRVRKRDMAVLKRYELPIPYFSVFEVIHDARKGRVYTLWGPPPALISLDTTTGKIVEIRLDQQGVAEAGAYIYVGSQLTANGNQLYSIVMSGREGMLVEFDLTQMRISRVMRLPGVGSSLDLDEKRDELWVGGAFVSRLYVIDRKSLKVKRVLPAPTFAIRRLLLDTSGEWVYVLDHMRGAVHILSRMDGRKMATFNLGGFVYDAVEIGRELWVPGPHGIFAIKMLKASWRNALKEAP